ncbi:MAG: AlkA N-terminal domain-containing protein, partial [Bryobacteraceae bacterium]
TFRALYRRPPSELRRRRRIHEPGLSLPAAITLHLAYQSPYDWDSMLAWLDARAIEGVEEVRNGRYRRTVSREGSDGVVEVSNDPVRQGLSVGIQFPYVRVLPAIVLRVLRLFDLDADVNGIGTHLSNDPALARLIAERPGLRAPGGWDGFELAVRAILGQQITVEAARQLAGQLVRICNPSPAAFASRSLTRVFPSARCLAASDLSALGMPNSRKNTLKALAEAAIVNPRLFDPAGSLEEAIVRLRAIPGVGDWTAQYIALRALRETDAFPASDVGILRGAAKLDGIARTAAQLIDRAERWRPWRAYAAQHLWAAGAPIAQRVRRAPPS